MVPDTARTSHGWARADSIVVNPHKWLFTPFDLSAFYCRRMDVVRQAFSLVPEYLQTPEGARGVKNLMDTGIQLGRRFRSLKLWMVLRHFGAERHPRALARAHAAGAAVRRLGRRRPDFERLAPVPFSVVCFRARPLRSRRAPAELDALNEQLLDAVNATGEVFLSHTQSERRVRAAARGRQPANDGAARGARVGTAQRAQRPR